MYNQGTKYLHTGKALKAIACFKKELDSTSYKELHLNIGNAYRLVDNDSLAMKHYLLAASSDVPFSHGRYGPYALALNNIGLLTYSSGDPLSAIDYYNAAITLDSSYGEAIWNRGNAKLKLSNCVVGWDDYEYRFDRGVNSVRIGGGQMWEPDLLEADCILEKRPVPIKRGCIYVQTEQGLGDKIMFGRYLHLLERYFSTVIVVCHESLDCLYPYTCVRSVPIDALSIPICSLARIFGVVDSTYLLGKFSAYDFTGFNIGICSTGSPTHTNDRNRSCNIGYFSSLSRFGSLYDLSPAGAKVKWCKSLKPKNWEETASYLLGLDLLVSVDTSLVHMAGSLGVPCLMVQPLKETDFRWGMPLDTNVWYPSVTVINNPGSWTKTFTTVGEIIETII